MVEKRRVEVGKERKRKIGEDEEEEESSGSDDNDFLSNEAFKVMQKTLLKKGFLGERGFKEIIPPFKEVIKKRGWTSIYTHFLVGLIVIVREFYAIMWYRKELQCYV